MNEDPPDKPALLAAYQVELPKLQASEPVVFEIGRIELACLIAAVQLACRHPRYPRTSRRIVEDTIRQMAAGAYANFPAAQALIDRGWDQAYDDLVEPPSKERR